MVECCGPTVLIVAPILGTGTTSVLVSAVSSMMRMLMEPTVERGRCTRHSAGGVSGSPVSAT